MERTDATLQALPIQEEVVTAGIVVDSTNVSEIEALLPDRVSVNHVQRPGRVEVWLVAVAA